MPKMKTHSGAKKRFRKTASGKLSRRQANVAHYLENKTGQRRRRLQTDSTIAKPDEKRVKRMLGG